MVGGAVVHGYGVTWRRVSEPFGSDPSNALALSGVQKRKSPTQVPPARSMASLFVQTVLPVLG